MNITRLLLTASLCCAPAAALAQDTAQAVNVYELADVETSPVPTNLEELRAALEATYPAARRAAGQGATVSVAFVLGADGMPRDLSVTQSTDAAFDSVTLAAMSLLRFTPATVGGQPVAVRVEVPVQWEPGDVVEAGDGDAAPAFELPAGVRAYELDAVDEMPRLMNPMAFARELERRYPAALRDARIEGLVQVRLLVSDRGEVADARVTQSSEAQFDTPTVEAVRVVRFRPARVDRKAVWVWVDLPIRWTVGEPQAPPPPAGERPDKR